MFTDKIFKNKQNLISFFIWVHVIHQEYASISSKTSLIIVIVKTDNNLKNYMMPTHYNYQ